MKTVRALSHRRSSDAEKELDAAVSAAQSRRARKAANKRIAASVQPDTEDEATFQLEWRMTKQQEDQKLDQFLKKLKELGALQQQFDRYTYRRFLRARQHDIKRATEMWLAHLKWRKEMGADTILDDFTFPERDAFISLYPQGYCNIDKMGRPVYIQHVGQINLRKMYELTTEERMLKFHVQEYERCMRYIMPACSKAAGRHLEQTFAIIDLKGVGFSHLTGDVKKMLGKVLAIDQDNYPEMLGHTCLINAGAVISFLFRFIKPMLDIRTQNKIEVCPKDYVPALLKWIPAENLPEYLGGKSKATLLDDAGPWNDPALVAEIDAEIKANLPRIAVPASEASFTSGASPVAGTSPQGSSPRGMNGEAPSHPMLPNYAVGPRESAEDAFFEAERIRTPSGLVVRATSVQSSIDGDADGGYYSPKSPDSMASGYFSAAESVPASISSVGSRRAPAPGPYQPLPTSPTSPPGGAAAAAAREDDSGADSGDEGPISSKWRGKGPSVQPLEARTGPAMNGTQIPLLARVRALEERMVQLHTRAPQQHLPPGGRLAERDFGDGTIMARVATLEQAVVSLTRVQEAALEAEQQRKEPGCCSACCIM